ncbi:hypothetical protein N692_02735 [Lactiplantibacillus plantarum EGD-AQ4]|nr:hypothetical protein N692_02735 [Lactiplantibacillus plantarum EGD-AQ4]
MGRKRQNKPLKEIISIYCEGTSEVEYFKMLRRKYRGSNVQAHQVGLKIESMDSMKGTKLITEIVDKTRPLKKKRQVNAVFAVFDRDDLTHTDIQRAQKLARANEIEIIFSSTNFEVWILLHFIYFSKAYTKLELNHKLSAPGRFNQDYARFKGAEYDKFLVDRVSTAISNARRLAITQTNLVTDDPFVNIQEHIKRIFGRED